MLNQPTLEKFASLIGRGIVEFGRYKESLKFLNGAISIADSHPEIARPMIAYEAKVDALVGLERFETFPLMRIAQFSALSARGMWQDARRKLSCSHSPAA